MMCMSYVYMFMFYSVEVLILILFSRPLLCKKNEYVEIKRVPTIKIKLTEHLQELITLF